MAGEFQYGGQAIIEGVMIRGKTAVASAVRRPDSSIVIHTEPVVSLVQTYRWLGWRFLRGTPALIDSLRIGFRALLYSAEVSMEAEGIKPPSKFHYFLTIAGALAFGLGIFVLLPSLLLQPLHQQHSITKNFFEGIIRLCFFIGYVLIISLWANIRRIFEYHGAEHMVINAFEAGKGVSAEAAKEYGTVHVRCGSSFIMLVLFIAIVVHALAGWPVWYVRLPLRLLMLVPIAGISYEVMKWAASPRAFWLTAAVIAPGMWLQRLTTRKPDDQQIEVAVAALEAALQAEAATKDAASQEASEAVSVK